MDLVFLALAPVFIIGFYIYYRDKYEKEPLGIIFKALFAGILISFPIMFAESFLSSFAESFGMYRSAYDAFVVAAFTEEAFKFIALYLLFWKNSNFNEKFDGLVYAVFISLGFAGFENMLYVLKGGTQVGWIRTFTAVPLHALGGAVMGYYFGIAKFFPAFKNKYLRLSFLMPFLLHGIYDFILMAGHPVLLTCFFPFIIFLWVTGFKKMKTLSQTTDWSFRKD
ncbi:MAG TPA: PrsW family glutamic-type intramembrane protease [Bacteroidales bacterium]|nr:PrsW family glutamic-type intramembrane protease [Bacteroidales bacterium]